MISQPTPPKLAIRKVLGNIYIELINCDSWSIGRSEECEITLDDTWASRKHAMVTKTIEGDFYYQDLGSRNGSMINGLPVNTEPVLLQDGDVLTVGTSELEFHHPSGVAKQVAELKARTILIVSLSLTQAEIWRATLASQGLDVATQLQEINLQQWLDDQTASGSSLPDLLIIDIEAQKPSPYAFCRWCRTAYPQVKILLISTTRTEIFPVERQWAIHQGAQDLLPSFPTQNLITNPISIVQKVDAVFRALQWRPAHQRPMMTALLDVQERLKSGLLDLG